MSDTTFTIGAEVTCQDGVCGDLRRVVVDPIRRAVTYLVVEPRHRQGLGHLVPIDLVDTTVEQIQLHCTSAQFEALEDADEIRFLPGAIGPWDYGQDEMLSQPYFGLGVGGGLGLGAGGIGTPAGLGGGIGIGALPEAVSYDKVPVGEVEIQRGDHVQATDGAIGRVRGLVVDPADHHVTHVLLDEGHLWGQKEVAIPISAVTDVSEGVQLNLTKDEVRDLPAVEIDHPA